MTSKTREWAIRVGFLLVAFALTIYGLPHFNAARVQTTASAEMLTAPASTAQPATNNPIWVTETFSVDATTALLNRLSPAQTAQLKIVPIPGAYRVWYPKQ